jgi:hypothetical protein
MFLLVLLFVLVLVIITRTSSYLSAQSPTIQDLANHLSSSPHLIQSVAVPPNPDDLSQRSDLAGSQESSAPTPSDAHTRRLVHPHENTQTLAHPRNRRRRHRDTQTPAHPHDRRLVHPDTRLTEEAVGSPPPPAPLSPSASAFPSSPAPIVPPSPQPPLPHQTPPILNSSVRSWINVPDSEVPTPELKPLPEHTSPDAVGYMSRSGPRSEFGSGSGSGLGLESEVESATLDDFPLVQEQLHRFGKQCPLTKRFEKTGTDLRLTNF